MDDLRYIRETMARASSFTAISGLGFVTVGFGALLTGVLAAPLDHSQAWVGVWIVDAAFSLCVGLASTAIKARKSRQSLLSGPFRKFALSFAPALAAGALLTLRLVQIEQVALLPAVWLLIYGAGLVAGGAFSVRVIPVMGSAFMISGALAALGPLEWGPWLMIAGFGVLHITFGLVIWKRHGG
jgi:hypothetical protein